MFWYWASRLEPVIKLKLRCLIFVLAVVIRVRIHRNCAEPSMVGALFIDRVLVIKNEVLVLWTVLLSVDLIWFLIFFRREVMVYFLRGNLTTLVLCSEAT